MNKEHLHFTIGVSCIVAFFFLWIGIYVGRRYQDNIYKTSAMRLLSEAKELAAKADKQLDSTQMLLKSFRDRVDSITVVKTVYIKR